MNIKQILPIIIIATSFCIASNQTSEIEKATRIKRLNAQATGTPKPIDLTRARKRAEMKKRWEKRRTRYWGSPTIIEQPEKDKPKDRRSLNRQRSYQVVRIVDGDTIVVSDYGREVTVRLIGVNTPETKHPYRKIEPYGIEAYRFLRNLLQGETVYISEDNAVGKDKYGRTLGYVQRAPDGLFVNAEIIRQGYGYIYREKPFAYMNYFEQLEIFAEITQKGLWNPKGF